METAKLNKKAIIDIFDLEQSGLYDIDSQEPGPVNLEEESGHVVDSLIDILCDGEDDIYKYYSKFVKTWGDPDHGYEIIMSTDEDDNELMLSTVLDNDIVVISRDERFTSTDLFNILCAINSQTHFNDLYIAVQKDSDSIEFSGTVYHEESFAISKTWISDLLNMFREGEFDYYKVATITSDFDQLDLEPTDGVVRDDRLYVMFNLNY